MKFKQKAIETFVNNIKTKLPDITDHEIEIMKLSFSSGLNIGIFTDRSELEQQIALQLLSI